MLNSTGGSAEAHGLPPRMAAVWNAPGSSKAFQRDKKR